MATSLKVFALGSAACALVFCTWLGAAEWPALAPLAAAAFLGIFALVRRLPHHGWAPLLLTAYVFPALLHATRGTFVPAYHAIWFAGLLGAIVATPGLRQWQMPAAWRLPLGYWALVVALAWPLVAMREMNFNWASLARYDIANSGLGGPPPVVIVSMLVAALTQLLGILWFDTMFAAFRAGGVALFRRVMVVPLLVSLAAGSMLAIYQMAVDINFLSAHQWPFYGRAAGGLLDGNAFGALQGLWSAPALSLALTGTPAFMAGGLTATLLLWGGLWATGSRMALLSGLIGLAFVGYAAVRTPGSNRRRLALAAGALVIVLAVLLGLGRWRMDPVSRTIASLTHKKRTTIAQLVEFELWNRFGPFGTASVRMVADSPAVGIGVGTFELLVPDYAHVVTQGRTRAHFDNAQSWYRHRLAELGLLGSLGWIAWVGLFGIFVWKAAPARAGLTEATGVRAALVAVAVISTVSMPTRNAFVGLSFWVLAFWLFALAPRAAGSGPPLLAVAAARRWSWGLVWMLAILFAAGTAWTGYHHLRPPHRALMAEWNYLNGISRPVRTPDGIRRSAGEHGVAVFRARRGYLKLVIQLPHADPAAEPVGVTIYERDARVASLLLSDNAPHTLYIPVPEGAKRMMIQTRVSRVARAAGARDEGGLMLHDWSFVPRVPAGGMIAGPGQP